MNQSKYCGVNWVLSRLEYLAYWRQSDCGVDDKCDNDCVNGVCWSYLCSNCSRLGCSCKFRFVGLLRWRLNLFMRNFYAHWIVTGQTTRTPCISNHFNGLYDTKNTTHGTLKTDNYLRIYSVAISSNPEGIIFLLWLLRKKYEVRSDQVRW